MFSHESEFVSKTSSSRRLGPIDYQYTFQSSYCSTVKYYYLLFLHLNLKKLHKHVRSEDGKSKAKDVS